MTRQHVEYGLCAAIALCAGVVAGYGGSAPRHAMIAALSLAVFFVLVLVVCLFIDIGQNEQANRRYRASVERNAIPRESRLHPADLASPTIGNGSESRRPAVKVPSQYEILHEIKPITNSVSRRVLVFRDFKNKLGLIIGEQFTPTLDDVGRLSKGERFKGLEKARTLGADGTLPDDGAAMCIALSFQVFGQPPGDGFAHEVIDINDLL